MRAESYQAAARRLRHFADRIEATASASTPQERAARTRAINAASRALRILVQRNATAIDGQKGEHLADVVVDHYPQLKQIMWSMPGAQTIPAADALALYEQRWTYVDKVALSADEWALIDRLAHEQGGGFFVVETV